MKYIVSIILLSASFQAFSQKPVAEIDDLRTPSAPGLILMDEAPASIEKPSTPQGLALSLLNFRNGGAIEVAPYWLKEHDGLNFDKHVYGKHPFLQTLSFSISNVVKGDTTNLSAGVRFHWLRLHNKASRNHVKAKLDSLNPNSPLDSTVDYAGILNRLNASLDRPTFLVDFAFAINGQSPTSSYDDFKKSRLGFWINLVWVPCPDKPWEIIALSRYTEAPGLTSEQPTEKFWDFGLRGRYAGQKVALSVEYIGRHNVQSHDEHRYDGILEYRINSNLYATATVGRNFEKKNDIIALFGINFGIHSKATLEP